MTPVRGAPDRHPTSDGARRVLVDLSIRTKAARRIREGLLPWIAALAPSGDLTVTAAVPEESIGDEALPAARPGFEVVSVPRRSDLWVENWWLPRASRSVDVVYTQREAVAPLGRPTVLHLHEHFSVRAQAWERPSVAVRAAYHQHRASRTYRSATEVLCSSEWVRGDVLRLAGREATDVHLAPLAGWPDGDPPPDQPGEPAVLTILSADVRDDPDWVRRVWDAADLGPEWRLRIAGRVTPTWRDPRVEWLGYLSEADLRDTFAGAAIYLHPSATEGFGMSLVEAFQSGCAVVAPRGTAVPEVVNGEAGMCALDPTAAGLALRRFAESDRHTLASNARKTGARYSWQACATEVVAACQRVDLRR